MLRFSVRSSRIHCPFRGCITPAQDTTVQVTDPAVKDWKLTLNGTSEKVLTINDLRRYPVTTGHGYAVSTTGIRFGPYLCTGSISGTLLPMPGE